MPGFEIIDEKEAKAVNKLFEHENGILFSHGFNNKKKISCKRARKDFNIF